MDIGSMLSAAGAPVMQNLGNIEKAIIEILDLRGRDPVLKDAIQVVAGAGVAGALGDAAAIGIDGDGLDLKNTFLGDYVQDLAGVGKDHEVADAYFEKLIHPASGSADTPEGVIQPWII